eukprot:CAMPEP_0174254992 /NCGR_PEP_ID=MMETSP0439-20130205/4320_1 /TAXON_ID=0 /ORGANISM="Stereomyxa ramosa, Strain Chinc5" /LENGTH=262 /DNA_ID=CAMNT_0015336927 /DNA_START=1598 /DNA_END=2386 /DNA_ORIENTATION=+
MTDHTGLTMVESLYEPLVINAGIHMFLRYFPNYLAQKFLDVLHDSTAFGASQRGKVLEYLIAIRLYQKSNCRIGQWWRKIQEEIESLDPNDNQPLVNALNKLQSYRLPDFKGILIGVSLDDPRVKLMERNSDWIIMPENKAGPDIIAGPMIISCNYNTRDFGYDPTVSSSNPNNLYCLRKGARDVLPKKGKWCQLALFCKSQVAKWDTPCFRVQIEYPCLESSSQSPTTSLQLLQNNQSRKYDLQIHLTGDNIDDYFVSEVK